jgi:hypothetical protein
VTVKTPVTQTDYRQVDEALDELHASLKYVDGHVPNEAISSRGMRRVLRTILRILILLVKEKKA